MKVISQYSFVFSPDNQPVEVVTQSEIVKFKAVDGFNNQVTSEEQLVASVDFDRVNPATGPVYVEGAQPGDVLVVDILDVSVADQGVTMTIPGLGPLADKAETRTRIIPIRDGRVVFNDVSFPVEPMVGVVGVAPESGRIPCGQWGSHGGNLDNKLIGKGARLFLPVYVPGALFQLGDLHAAMGDGEICGIGVEIAGEVMVKFNVAKNFSLERPALETSDKWYTMANAGQYDQALKLVTEDMQRLIVKAYGWDATDAYLYMSIQGDVGICQGCKPSSWDMVVRFGIPKITGRPLLAL